MVHWCHGRFLREKAWGKLRTAGRGGCHRTEDCVHCPVLANVEFTRLLGAATYVLQRVVRFAHYVPALHKFDITPAAKHVLFELRIHAVCRCPWTEVLVSSKKIGSLLQIPYVFQALRQGRGAVQPANHVRSTPLWPLRWISTIGQSAIAPPEAPAAPLRSEAGPGAR